ncbi:MAG TPA: tetratricopeptide repeat protein [Blastocatellia bacterium]
MKPARHFAIRTAAIICLISIAQVALPQETDEAIKRADALYKAARYREAIEAYKDALKRDPTSDQAIAYIAYSYLKLGEKETAREWMRRRIDLPNQTPSLKSRTLAEIALTCWDEAHLELASRRAENKLDAKAEAAAKKLLAEGIESAQKAITLAPRSVKAFNLLNLLYRESASVEADATRKKELLANADTALRRVMQLLSEIPELQSAADMFTSPIAFAAEKGNSETPFAQGKAVRSFPLITSFDDKEPVMIEAFVDANGRVLLPRVLQGRGAKAALALAVARRWLFEPSTFDGKPIHSIQIITFTESRRSASGPEVLPDDVLEHFHRGERLMRAGQYDEAISAYKTAQSIAGKPSHTLALALGNAYYEKKDYPSAVEAYRQAAAVRPNDLKAYFNLGEVHYAMGQYAEAESDYRKVIEFDPGTAPPMAYHFLGLALYNQKKIDEAIAQYRMAIEFSSGNYAEARYNLGIALLSRNQFKEAEAEFRLAVSQERKNWPEAHFNLANALEKQNRFREAAEEYEIYLRLSPSAEDAARIRSRIEWLRKQK